MSLILLLSFVCCCNAQNTTSKDTIVEDVLYEELKEVVKIGDVKRVTYYLNIIVKDSLFYDKGYSQENSLLTVAFKNRDSKIIDVLLQQSLSKKKDSSFSENVKAQLTNRLKKAIEVGDLLMVKTLVKYGANAFDEILLTTNNGRFQRNINTTLLKNLIENESIRLNKTEMISFFINYFKKSHSLTSQEQKQYDDFQSLSLIYFIKLGNHKKVIELLGDGTVLNSECYDCNPLFAAISVSDIKMVELLVEYGADVNIVIFVNEKPSEWEQLICYYTPLLKAQFMGNKNIIDFLKQKGAKLEKNKPCYFIDHNGSKRRLN